MKLEGGINLNWVNKKGALIYEEDRPKWVHPRDIRIAERRPLIYDKKLSTKENAENVVVQGDNLLAMNTLLPLYENKIQMIYIDPPYNTKKTFDHYDDNLQHSEWLTFMRDRLTLAKKFLHPEQGSIWIQLDDDEHAYLKVLCDEIFGRSNFVASVVWQKKFSPQNDAKYFSDMHDYILIYAKNKDTWQRNLMPRTNDSRYKNVDNDPRGVWTSGDLSVKTPNPKDIYPIITPSGREVWPPKGSSWRVSKERFEELVSDNRIWFGKTGNNVPRLKRFLSEVQQGVVPSTWWPHEDTGHNQEAKQEIKKLFPDSNEPFSTPKPERLMERIIQIASKEGDTIMDFFGGSGTTGAVAHRLKRKSILIEKGEHAEDIIVPRFNMLFNGESIYENKKTPGDLSFYKLGPSILNDSNDWNKDLDIDVIAKYALLNLDFNLVEKVNNYYIGCHFIQKEHYCVFAFDEKAGLWTDRRTSEVLNIIPRNMRLTIYTNNAVVDLPSNQVEFKPIPAAIVKLFSQKAFYGQGGNINE